MSDGAPDDYYALLGVTADVSDAELRLVWRRLALKFHPDHAGPEATATFQKLSSAYAVLSDPVARAAYDRRRRSTTVKGSTRRSAEAASTPSGTRRRPTPPRAAAPGVMLSRQSGPLQSLLARGIARVADDDVIELYLNAEEAAQGGMVTISMRVPIRCPACGGTPRTCTRCGSTRTVEELYSAWLAVPPGVADGAVLKPSEDLPGMTDPVTFRMRVRATRQAESA